MMEMGLDFLELVSDRRLSPLNRVYTILSFRNNLNSGIIGVCLGILVEWPSGLRRRFAKPLRGKTLAQVRILSPPHYGEELDIGFWSGCF